MPDNVQDVQQMRVSYKQFKDLVKQCRELSDRNAKLHGLGIDLLDYNEDFHRLIDGLWKALYPDKCEWVQYLLYDCDYGRKALPVTLPDGTETKATIKNVWRWAEENSQ